MKGFKALGHDRHQVHDIGQLSDNGRVIALIQHHIADGYFPLDCQIGSKS